MKDRDKKWIHEGFITESLSNGMFRVRLDNEDRSCSWINEHVQKFYLPLPFYESLPFCVWHRHALWQHPLIRNLI